MSQSQNLPPGLKLNLGCGHDKGKNFINVDKFGEPDVLWDLEKFPWPWDDNSAELVVMNHVLEHLGATTEVFFGIIKELYRVCRDGARVKIAVPHPRCDEFLQDPTHVRIITPELWALLSKRQNLKWKADKGANSLLALYYDVDFELVDLGYTLLPPYAEQFNSKQITPEQLVEAAKKYNNVIKETRMEIRVIKPLATNEQRA